jgi:carbonic anhydrase
MKLAKYLVLSLLVVIAIAAFSNTNNFSIAESLEWGYSGAEGPSNWGDISPEFAACKAGKEQSPINLENASEASLPKIQFTYDDTPFNIVNNGHTIKINYKPGSRITIRNKDYELLQFHFHAPSEHTLNGKSYPMEVHLAHQSADGEYAVLGIFIEEGKENEFINVLWSNIPQSGEQNTVSGVEVNASALPPQNKSYYHYDGSFTTPPCTEGVSWNVFATPIEASKEQIANFTSFYNGNARPVQPLNNRKLEATR